MKNKGFTLIELMIVVAIIAIIAAIAIPNLLRSRMSANEASAIGAIRTISSAETQYQAAGLTTDATTGLGQYGTLAELSAAVPPFVDEVLGLSVKSGYDFVEVLTPDPAAPSYTCQASPTSQGSSGVRGFFVDDSGVVRFSTTGTAVVTDLPL